MNESRRCVATNRAGIQCRRAPIAGGSVCRHHGGGAPQVKRAAKLRLLELIDPAIAGLERALTIKGACTQCGRADDMSIVLRAAQLVLDRAGLGPSSTLEVQPPGHGFREDLADLSDVELVHRVEELAAEARLLPGPKDPARSEP
jgi:hypothetical protein